MSDMLTAIEDDERRAREFPSLRNTELLSEDKLRIISAHKIQKLEEENVSLRRAGHRLAMLMCDIVLDKKIDEQAMRYAIAQWSKARDKEESK